MWPMKSNFFREKWEKAASDLSIEVLIPFDLRGEGINLVAEVLVKNFGGEKGTLVFKDFDEIRMNHPQLVQLGYGWSILEAASPNYNREVFIEMLSEWEWTGEEAGKPDWVESE